MLSRLKFEFEDMKKYPQFTLETDKTHSNIWYVSFVGADKTLYAKENFKLKFVFDDEYVNIYYLIFQPIERPAVTFIENIPINPFVFSNGFICLSILETEWSPALKVSAVTLSILSMLSSTKEKRKPHNDAEICSRGWKSPKDALWFHIYKDV